MEFAYIWYLLNNLYYAEILFWRPAAVGRWLCLKVHQLAHRGVLRRACLARRLRAGSAGNSFPVAKTIEDVQLQNSTRTFLSCTNLRIWIYWLQRILEYDLCMALDFILEYCIARRFTRRLFGPSTVGTRSSARERLGLAALHRFIRCARRR